MLRIGLVGCGAIGNVVGCEVESSAQMELLACFDVQEEKVLILSQNLKRKLLFLKPCEMVKQVDVIVEAAHPKAVPELLALVVENNKKLLVASVGGLIGQERLLDEIAKGRGELFVSSGALAGIDAVKSLPKEEIWSCTLTTTKPPQSVMGAPFFKENPLDLDKIVKNTLLFEGTAIDAAAFFPQNLNVAVTLSLAGVGFEKTKVRIFVDPQVDKNIHEICVEGSFGRIVTRTENTPSPSNPKTSFLAALSVVASLKKLTSSIHIGT